MKTSELEGAELNLWVAKARGVPLIERNGRMVLNTFDDNHLAPPPDFSTDWSQGGPLIEEYGIQIMPSGSNWQAVSPDASSQFHGKLSEGPTPLIAAMRCLVASKFGEEVND